MGGLGPNKEHWAFLCEGHAKDARIPIRRGEDRARSDRRGSEFSGSVYAFSAI
jgi:hypothetical protein